MIAVAGSGMTSMSEAWIGCQPRIDEPSKPSRPRTALSSSSLIGIVKCCQMPRKSMNFKSTATALLFLGELDGVLRCHAVVPPLVVTVSMWPWRAPGHRWTGRDGCCVQMASGPRSPVRMRTTSSIGHDEDLAVADAPGLRRLLDCVDDLRDLVVLHDDLELHLGQEVHDVLGAAVELGVALLPAEALDLSDGHALDADAAQRLSFTSSSLNGLMIASTFFMVPPWKLPRLFMPRTGACKADPTYIVYAVSLCCERSRPSDSSSVATRSEPNTARIAP